MWAKSFSSIFDLNPILGYIYIYSLYKGHFNGQMRGGLTTDRTGRRCCAQCGTGNIRWRRMVIAHTFPQDRRLFVSGNREVSIRRVFARWLRHLETFGVLNAPLSQLHPSENRDHSKEHDNSHKASDDQTFATCYKGINLSTRWPTKIVQKMAVGHSFQRSDFRATRWYRFSEQSMVIECVEEQVVWTVVVGGGIK